MLYQLVLITNLGMVTPLATFDTQGNCLREQALLQKTAQYSTACLPTQSPEQLQKQLESSMKMMMDTITKLQQSK